MNTAVPIDIDAWIQRDETPYGYRRRGRQSRFEDPDYVRFDAYGYPLEEDPENHKSYIRRSGTLNAIATGAATVAVAGYRYSDGLPATYSASGPEATDSAKLNSGFRRSPDAMAVSDDSVTCRGVLAAGTRSGSVAAMNGTSVAAAYVTRLLAEKEIPVDAAGLEAATRKSFRQRVHDYADQQDSPNPLSELSSAPQTINRQQRKRPKLPEQRAGGGRLEVQKKTLVKKDLRIGHREK
jgi:hypothetical protein